MCAHEVVEPRDTGTRIETALSWLGGGQWHEPGERQERSAGVVVLVNAALAWLMATVVVVQSTRWPILAVWPLTLVFAVLVGTVVRSIAASPQRNRRGLAGRVAVAIAVGAVVGELAALVLFSGSINGRLDEQAARNADSAPAALAVTADLQRLRTARTALDEALDRARLRRDEALVVARCEYHPTPACPQTHITGVPGSGPETRTANELLGAAQQELDAAAAERDRRAPALDAQVGSGATTLTQISRDAIVNADRGLGARWVALQQITSADVGTLLLRLAAIAFFALLSLLPLILARWRGETTQDRHAAARAELDRAEVEADVAIAVKRAEVRAAVETMWAEHQLAQARLAVEAQAEIDRAQQRRRVAEALEAAPSLEVETVEEDMYLPIAAEAEAASLVTPDLPAVAELPAAGETGSEPANLPAVTRAAPAIPTIPDVTRAAARWIRPLVPPIVARAIDTTTHPLRTARQVFEDVEEMTFSFKRTRKVTVDTEESAAPPSGGTEHDPVSAISRDVAPAAAPTRPVQSAVQEAGLAQLTGPAELRAGTTALQLPPADHR